MKKFSWPLILAAGALLTMPSTAVADNGNASPTLSFFSGGDGAQAHWLATSDQPPGDTDNQAIELVTTNDAPTFSKGFAGILVHHVTGIPAESFQDSSFWVKTPSLDSSQLATEGSPRIVVEFQTAAGTSDGDAELTENVRGNDWEKVSDEQSPANQTLGAYPNSGWDIHSASCPFMYHQKWSVAQSCHAGDTVSVVFLVADPLGVSHLIDDITINGQTFSSASDNGGGMNDPAGPDATIDLSLLPPLVFPPL